MSIMMNDELYAKLCTIPVVQTAVGGATVFKNFALLITDLVVTVLNKMRSAACHNQDNQAERKWTFIETYIPDPDTHVTNLVLGFLSAIPVIGTLFNLYIILVHIPFVNGCQEMQEIFDKYDLEGFERRNNLALKALSLSAEQAEDPIKLKEAYDNKVREVNDAHDRNVKETESSRKKVAARRTLNSELFFLKEAYEFLLPGSSRDTLKEF